MGPAFLVPLPPTTFHCASEPNPSSRCSSTTRNRQLNLSLCSWRHKVRRTLIHVNFAASVPKQVYTLPVVLPVLYPNKYGYPHVSSGSWPDDDIVKFIVSLSRAGILFRAAVPPEAASLTSDPKRIPFESQRNFNSLPSFPFLMLLSLSSIPNCVYGCWLPMSIIFTL